MSGAVTAATVGLDRPPIDRAHAVDLLRKMILIRRFEEKSAEMYAAGKIRGFLHLAIGEEAVSAGVLSMLRPTDRVVATYREHGHALVRGIGAGPVMAEMFGRQEGCSRGRGGSMHLFDAATRFYGGNAIVGGGLPLAVGLALADRMTGTGDVTCCLFGDGAFAEGEFHESINLAALWRLPVLFACENNLYAMGTALAVSHASTDLAKRAAGYGVPSEAVDAMDVVAVESAAKGAVDAIRAGAGPRFLELRTYRFRPHSMFDPELYRPKGEVESWKARCPIATFVARLEAWGMSGPAEVAAIEADVEREVAAAVDFAEAGTLEPVADLDRFVLSPGSGS